LRTEEIKIIGFLASNDTESCNLFSYGHEKVLIDVGLKTFVNPQKEWHKRDDVYVVLALQNDIPVGGIKLEQKIEGKALNCESLIRPLVPNISEIIDSQKWGVIGEAGGLWHDKSMANKDLSKVLGRTIIGVAELINVKCVLSLNGKHTYRMARDVGSQIFREIGDDGYLHFDVGAFDKDQWSSALFFQNDLEKLSRASKDAKNFITNIRQDPKLKISIETNTAHFDVSFDLAEIKY
jgi:hypothetical protein